ncbi:MAG: hypothetical protein KAH32_03445 [Chlamydiia bacterium]|nr:hypothetical protein [Chlamydiia bacterium]
MSMLSKILSNVTKASPYLIFALISSFLLYNIKSPEVTSRSFGDLIGDKQHNDRDISLYTKDARIDISLVGGSISNIWLKKGQKNIIGSSESINSNLQQSTATHKPSENAFTYKRDRASTYQDKNEYISTIRSSSNSENPDKLVASQGMQIISDNPEITFGKYKIINIKNNEVVIKLSLDAGTIIKRFYTDENLSTSTLCDISITGFDNEKLWVSAGLPEEDSIMNNSYYRVIANFKDNEDASYSSCSNMKLPKSNTDNISRNNINWISNRSGMYSLILDSINQKLDTSIKIVSLPNKLVKKKSIPVKQAKDCYITLIEIRDKNATFRLTSAPCSYNFLSHLDSLTNNDMQYSSIENIYGLFGFIMNPILKIMNYIISYVEHISSSHLISLAVLIACVMGVSSIINKSAKKHALISQGHIKLVKLLTAQKDAGILKIDHYNKQLVESMKKNKSSIVLSILLPISRIVLVIAMGMFFRFSFSMKGLILVPGWINDLSNPDALFYIKSLPLLGMPFTFRLLPVIVGASSIFRIPKNINIHPIAKLLIPFGIATMLYNAPSGFQIYFILSSLIIGSPVGDMPSNK